MAKVVPARGVRSQAIRDYLAKNPSASPRQVAEDLRKTGVVVSEGLVNNIKYGGKSKAKRKAGGGKRAVKGTSLSQHVRDYLAQHPNSSPKEIVNGLAALGTTVSVGLASLIRYSPQKGSVRRRGSSSGSRAASGSLSAADLIEAKKLVDGLGGIAAARQALELLEQLR